MSAVRLLAQSVQSQRAAVDAAIRGEASYDRLPAWHELSKDQQRLATGIAACFTTPAADAAGCWSGISPDVRATFFMITYALEHTDHGGSGLIQHVTSIEGVLVPARAQHKHRLTNVTATVDGWRIHLMIKGFAVADLVKHGWDQEGLVHSTHYKGPFLQLVLNAAADSSDSDLDRGRFDHHSSPKGIYERFRIRYPETETVLKIS
jgi:hypothetical protein